MLIHTAIRWRFRIESRRNQIVDTMELVDADLIRCKSSDPMPSCTKFEFFFSDLVLSSNLWLHQLALRNLKRTVDHKYGVKTKKQISFLPTQTAHIPSWERSTKSVTATFCCSVSIISASLDNSNVIAIHSSHLLIVGNAVKSSAVRASELSISSSLTFNMRIVFLCVLPLFSSPSRPRSSCHSLCASVITNDYTTRCGATMECICSGVP